MACTATMAQSLAQTRVERLPPFRRERPPRVRGLHARSPSVPATSSEMVFCRDLAGQTAMLRIVVRQGKENMNGGGHGCPRCAGDPRRQAV